MHQQLFNTPHDMAELAAMRAAWTQQGIAIGKAAAQFAQASTLATATELFGTSDDARADHVVAGWRWRNASRTVVLHFARTPYPDQSAASAASATDDDGIIPLRIVGASCYGNVKNKAVDGSIPATTARTPRVFYAISIIPTHSDAAVDVTYATDADANGSFYAGYFHCTTSSAISQALFHVLMRRTRCTRTIVLNNDGGYRIVS